MIQLSVKDKEKVLEAIRKGTIDVADVSFPNLIDAIILKMKDEGMLELLGKAFSDKRSSNMSIPFHLILTLFITAKMKIKTSLTDVPFAITDADTLSEIGWNIWDNQRSLEEGLMDEGTLRNIITKYRVEEIINAYNIYVQENVFPRMAISPDIHILDCTEIEVKLSNSNYEGSEVIKDDDGTRRGYKLATLRGISGDTGFLEEIKMGSIKQHDLELSREMVIKSKMLKAGDIIINDRGFISRELLNYLKEERKIDTYIPVKKNMEIYEQAVSVAKEQNKWVAHPNKKRKNQSIAFVTSLGCHWGSDEPKKDVELNACVVYDSKKEEYFVFITTDLERSAKQIVSTYELRPEIEEDYRQIKDFWRLEDFKSTKHNFIAFHIVAVLIGYLYFQLYKSMEEGVKYAGKSLPVAVKNYVMEGSKSVIIYSGQYFAIFGFLEFIQLYSTCGTEVKKCLDKILAKV
jgi:hypothetical protein